MILTADRAFYLSVGLCSRCGKYRLFGDEKQCPECRAKIANDQTRHRKKNRESVNSNNREFMRNLRSRRKEQGLCPECGRKPSGGYITCGICRYKKRNGYVLQPDRYELGLCRFCDNPVEPGYRVCEEHHRQNIERARSSNAVKARQELIKSGVLY